MNMKHVLENEKLTIYLEGELNSFTAEQAENDIEQIVKENKFQSLDIDFKDLYYISSAGIRIIIRLKQRYDDTSLVNVPDEIFKIFDMVGLSNVLTIKRL